MTTPLRRQLTCGGRRECYDPISVWIATAVTGATAGFAFSAVYLLSSMAMSMIASWALAALAPDPMAGMNNAANGAGIRANIRDAAAPQEFVYGRVRKGGVVTYFESTDNTYFLHMILCLAGHKVHDIPTIYINDKRVTLNAHGFVTNRKWTRNTYDTEVGLPAMEDVPDGRKSMIRIGKHFGGDNQAPDNALINSSKILSNKFQGKGIAYLYVRFEADKQVFSDGLPNITAIVEGFEVYDPRDDQTKFSANAALVIRHYIHSEIGVDDPNTSNANISSQANVCDEDINLTTRVVRRYQINAVIKANESRRSVLTKMMSACAGELYYGQGQWQLKVGYYTPPVKDFDITDLRSAINLKTRTAIENNFNIVRGTFMDAAADWIEGDYKEVRSNFFIREDNDEEKVLELHFPYTTDAFSARSNARSTLFRSREQQMVVADFSMKALELEVGDNITLTIDRYGWDHKEFEVKGYKFFIDQDRLDPRIQLVLKETSETAFDDDPNEVEIIDNDTNLPDPDDVAEAVVIPTASMRVVNEQVIGVITATLQAGIGFFDQYEVQYRKSGTTAWKSFGRGSSDVFEIVGVEDGFFDFRSRAITSLGKSGEWYTLLNWQAVIFAPPPSDVQGFAANVVNDVIHFSWNAVPDLDLSHYIIRYSNKMIGANYNEAVDLIPMIARPATSVTTPARSGTYFIKAVDKMGNRSVNVSAKVVSAPGDFVQVNLVKTLTAHPNFTGELDRVILLNDGLNFITLDSSEAVDDLIGNVDDLIGNWDSLTAQSPLTSQGSFGFAEIVDLGASYPVKINADLDTFVYSISGMWDDFVGDVDDLIGDVDIIGVTTPVNFDTASASAQVRWSDDGIDWSPWQDFTVTDVTSRLFEFRLNLTTGDATNSIAIREATITFDMPERIERGDDIPVTGTALINYEFGFREIPTTVVNAVMSNGDRFVISDKTTSGFRITIYTGASVSVNPATIDYVSYGFGKEI